jgi:hypothetical protein
MTTTLTNPAPVLSPPVVDVPQDVRLTIDTEYEGTHTLTVQAAAFLEDGTVAVQFYHSPAIPGLPADFDLGRYVSLEGLICPHPDERRRDSTRCT